MSKTLSITLDNRDYNIEFDEDEFLTPTLAELIEYLNFNINQALLIGDGYGKSLLGKMAAATKNGFAKVFAPNGATSSELNGKKWCKKANEDLQNLGQNFASYCRVLSSLEIALKYFEQSQTTYYIDLCKQDIKKLKRQIYVALYKEAYHQKHKAEESKNNKEYASSVEHCKKAIYIFAVLDEEKEIAPIKDLMKQSSRLLKAEQAENMCEKAKELLNCDKYDQAINIFEQAKELLISANFEIMAKKCTDYIEKAKEQKLAWLKRCVLAGDKSWQAACKSFDEGKYSQAYNELEDAKKYYQIADEKDKIAKCTDLQNKCCYNKGVEIYNTASSLKRNAIGKFRSFAFENLDKAYRYYDAALDMFESASAFEMVAKCETAKLSCNKAKGDIEFSEAESNMQKSNFEAAIKWYDSARAYYSCAKESDLKRKCEENIKICKQSLAKQYFEKANNSLEAKHYIEAIKNAEKAAEIFHDLMDFEMESASNDIIKNVWRVQGDAKVEQGNALVAENKFDEADRCYIDAKDFYKKINDYKSRNKCDEMIKNCQIAKGDYYCKLGDKSQKEYHYYGCSIKYHYEEAREYYYKALKEYEHVGYYQGKVAAQQKIYDCNHKIDYEDGEKLYKDGEYHEHWQEYEEAIECYRAAIELGYDEHDRCSYGISRCEREIDRLKEMAEEDEHNQ